MMPKITIAVSRKEWVMIALFVGLLTWYLIYGGGCFHTPPMRIEHSVRPSLTRGASRDGTHPRTIYVTSFALDREYQLTSVKVFRVGDPPSGKSNPLLWHLVGQLRSAPTRSLVYGGTPEGMAPQVSGLEASELNPNETYRIEIEAGRLKGQHEFTLSSVMAPR